MLRTKTAVDIHVGLLKETGNVDKIDNFRIGLLYLNVCAFEDAVKYFDLCSKDTKVQTAIDFCNEKLGKKNIDCAVVVSVHTVMAIFFCVN